MGEYKKDYFLPIKECEGFISDMYTFVNDNYGAPDDEKLCDIMNEILIHNQELTNERVKVYQKTNISYEVYNPENTITEEKTIIPASQSEETNTPNLDASIELLKYSSDTDLDNVISRIPVEEYNYLKIYFHKLIFQIKKELLSIIHHNPLKDITSYQQQIEKYNHIINSLTILNEEQDNNQNNQKYNIIFVPNNKNKACIFDDLESLIESSDELGIIFDKLITHQFLNSKSIRQLVSYDKLYEYKSKTGFRVLYVTMGNNIAICSIFYKDKQKSTKITSYYELALSRYNSQKDYIENNLTDPDFMIEQSEFIGQIRMLLETRNRLTLQKKKGDNA